MLTLPDARAAFACPLVPLADREPAPGVPVAYDVYVTGCPRVRIVTPLGSDAAAEQAVEWLNKWEGADLQPGGGHHARVVLAPPADQPRGVA